MDYNYTRIKIPAKHLRALSLFAAENDLRHYLNGICIEKAESRPGVYLIATNGHTMIVIYEPDGQMVHEGKNVIMRLPKELLAASSRVSRGRHASQINLIARGNRVWLGTDFDSEQGDGEVYVMPGKPWVQGNYPDWRRVVPHFDKLKPVAASAFRAEYLGKFFNLYPGGRHHDTVRLWQQDNGGNVVEFGGHQGAIIVQVTAYPNVLGIIMPVYADRPSTNAFKAMIDQPPLDAEQPGERT